MFHICANWWLPDSRPLCDHSLYSHYANSHPISQRVAGRCKVMRLSCQMAN